MKARTVRPLRLAAVLALLVLGGCATHHQVRCDLKLVPINAPQPKAHEENSR